MDDKDLYSGLIRLHILHHACHEPVFGAGIIEELATHGYRLSPGTLYPLLHGLERKGYLRSFEEDGGRQPRRVYKATNKGHRALAVAKVRLRELFSEILEDDRSSKRKPHPEKSRRDIASELSRQLKIVERLITAFNSR